MQITSTVFPESLMVLIMSNTPSNLSSEKMAKLAISRIKRIEWDELKEKRVETGPKGLKTKKVIPALWQKVTLKRENPFYQFNSRVQI